MIKSEHGTVQIEGGLQDILADFTCIIQSLRTAIAEVGGEEMADRMITRCGEIAYMSDEERRKEAQEIITGKWGI